MIGTTSLNTSCFICNELSEQTVIRNTISMGLPDLDFRPSLTERYALKYHVQQCPHCGYCARDISTGDEIVEKFVRSNEYQKVLENKSLPDLANRFIAMGILMEMMEKTYLAFSSYQSAVWACDDRKHVTGMVLCRNMAIESLKKMHRKGTRISGDLGIDELICTDLMRRAGQFDSARSSLKTGLLSVRSEIIRHALLFESDLLLRWDTQSYRFDHIPDILEVIGQEHERMEKERNEWVKSN